MMKRSGQVGLVLMGAAAFAGTYASVAAYRASTAPQSAAQTCTTGRDGTQSCEPARRGFSYYLIPHFMYGSSAAASTPRPQAAAFAGQTPASATPAAPPAPKAQPVALSSAPAAAPKAPPPTLTYVARPTTPAVSSSGAQRGGFGTTAQSSSSRVSAGG
jgi:hypothetical protein